MIKALFFDIDGTLVSMKTHTIPTSAVESIAQAKRKGVKVFIATGRPYAIINNIDSILPFIDGYQWCALHRRERSGLSPSPPQARC